MEKYSRWRDKRTGVHPFLAPQPNAQLMRQLSTRVTRVLANFLVAPLLIVVKLPFVLIVFVWLLLAKAIETIIPVAFVRRGWHFVEQLGSRVLLALLGFWWIDARYVKTRQRSRIEDSFIPANHIRSGDVIIANHVSYIELFYLAFRFAPVFVVLPRADTRPIPTNVKNSDGSEPDAPPEVSPNVCVAKSVGLFGALRAVKNDEHVSVDDCEPIDVIVKRAASRLDGPVVVFPESVTSNGRSVLAPTPILQGLSKDTRINVVAFKYDFSYFSPSFVVGNFVWHFLRTLGQLHNTLQVRYLTAEEVPKPDGTSSFEDDTMGALATMLRVRRVGLGAKERDEFADYWNETQRGRKGGAYVSK